MYFFSLNRTFALTHRFVTERRLLRECAEISYPAKANEYIIREGAIIWYIKQSVMARIARVTLGVETSVAYNSADLGHRARETLVFTNSAQVLLLLFSDFSINVVQGYQAPSP